MKAIIEGKRYNTETARRIHEWDNGHGVTDFGWYSETLYQSKRGQYFLRCEGGAMSTMARTVGSTTTGDLALKLIDDNQARFWMVKHCPVELCEREFGPIEEG